MLDMYVERVPLMKALAFCPGSDHIGGVLLEANGHGPRAMSPDQRVRVSLPGRVLEEGVLTTHSGLLYGVSEVSPLDKKLRLYAKDKHMRVGFSHPRYRNRVSRHYCWQTDSKAVEVVEFPAELGGNKFSLYARDWKALLKKVALKRDDEFVLSRVDDNFVELRARGKKARIRSEVRFGFDGEHAISVEDLRLLKKMAVMEEQLARLRGLSAPVIRLHFSPEHVVATSRCSEFLLHRVN